MAGGGGFGRLRRILLTLVPVAALTSAGGQPPTRRRAARRWAFIVKAGADALRGHSPYVAASSIHSVGTAGFV
jgi:hypothetical protein